MQVADMLVSVFYAYLIVGFLFGLWFIFRGVQKIDDGMEEAKIGLRLLLLPGSVLLWPLMAKKFSKKK